MPLLRRSRPAPVKQTLDERLTVGQSRVDAADDLLAAAARAHQDASDNLAAVSREAYEESARLAGISNAAATTSNGALRKSEAIAAL